MSAEQSGTPRDPDRLAPDGSTMAEIAALHDFLTERAEGDLLAWLDQAEAMRRFDLSCADVEAAILEAGFLPKRYQRNRRMISADQQLKLFRSAVAVIGCGGLGGYILEELARIGVGRLVAIDPDVFEEHNLNRQLLSSPATLGKGKAFAAVQRVAEINPAVSIRPVQAAFAPADAAGLLAGVDAVADALDSIQTRLDLVAACERMNIPLVHGTIAGWFGYVTTVFPGEDTLQRLYSGWSGGKGIEADLGNPSFTPAVAASLEVAELIKVLLGTGTPLRGRVLCVNLLDMEMESVPLGPPTASP